LQKIRETYRECRVVKSGPVCLGLIAAQALFSYLVSGLAKLGSPVWRGGAALSGIFSASLYGNQRFFLLLNNSPCLAWLLSWTVIVFEWFYGARSTTRQPLVHSDAVYRLLISRRNRDSKGLNGFFFAFVGTYPAIYWLSHGIRHARVWVKITLKFNTIGMLERTPCQGSRFNRETVFYYCATPGLTNRRPRSGRNRHFPEIIWQLPGNEVAVLYRLATD
jgi:hypothetical protein